jgi:uncharacterized Rmd1/YagE family protein
MARCPIYDSPTACDQHRDCLFLRDGGCAIVLSMQKAFDNEKRLKNIEETVAAIHNNVRSIIDYLNRTGRTR